LPNSLELTPARCSGSAALSSRTRSRCEAGQTVAAGGSRFRTIQVYPKDLRALPGHPEPAVSWHSGFRGGAHARSKTTPVPHAARRRGSGVAGRGAGAAADAGGRISQWRIGRWVRDRCARIPPGPERHRLRRRRERRNRVSLGGGSIQSFASAGGRLGPP
jgi:hypothetical protein